MKNLRHLLPAMRPYRWTFVGGLALVVVSNFFATLVPRFLQRGIDALKTGGSFALVRHEIVLILTIAAVGGVARYGMRELLNGVSRRVETDLRDRLFQHLQILSASFYDRMPTGDIMARATNDLLAVRMVAGPALMYFVNTVVGTLMVLPYMIHISPRLTGLALLPLIALPIVMAFFGQAIHRRTLAIQAQYSILTSAAHENISGVRIIRAYQQERAEAVNFRRLNEEYARRNIALAQVAGAFHPILALLGGLGGAAVLYIGGSLVVAGTVTVGEFVAFGVYLVYLVWPMIALGWVVNLVQRGEASMGRLLALLQEQPAIVSPAAASRLPEARGGRTVKYEGVWFRYPNAPERGWVLQDIDFTVEAGRSLAVVGATGSGKSTLVELLPRAYDPDRGRVLIDGVDIRDLSLEDLREAIGFVPQETFLFSETLRNNILLGAPDDGRLSGVIETAQLSEALPVLPQGIDTMLGERGVNLSGGQKQRSAIARALAQDPPVFVLDDALSAVDGQTEAKILHGLRDALRGRTSIIVSHRLTAVRDADWILVLDEGRIVEQGTHAELMRKGGRYRDLLHRQQLEEEVEAGVPST